MNVGRSPLLGVGGMGGSPSIYILSIYIYIIYIYIDIRSIGREMEVKPGIGWHGDR